MKSYEYGQQAAESGSCPFGGDYADDLWVGYHGTSNHAEKEIDSRGFMWREDSYSKAEIESILEIFDHLHWAGSDTAGFTVLASFAKGDFTWSACGNQKPVFFAETSYRAL